MGAMTAQAWTSSQRPGSTRLSTVFHTPFLTNGQARKRSLALIKRIVSSKSSQDLDLGHQHNIFTKRKTKTTAEAAHCPPHGLGILAQGSEGRRKDRKGVLDTGWRARCTRHRCSQQTLQGRHWCQHRPACSPPATRENSMN